MQLLEPLVGTIEKIQQRIEQWGNSPVGQGNPGKMERKEIGPQVQEQPPAPHRRPEMEPTTHPATFPSDLPKSRKVAVKVIEKAGM